MYNIYIIGTYLVAVVIIVALFIHIRLATSLYIDIRV